MTGYTVNTGSTKKFASGWDAVFGPAGTSENTTDSTSEESAAKSTEPAAPPTASRRKKSS